MDTRERAPQLSATIAEPGERARERANTQQAHMQRPRRKAERSVHRTVPCPGGAQRPIPERSPQGGDYLRRNMTSTFQGRAGCRGRTIVAVLLAAVATVVGMVGAPAPAHAADAYIALSIGFINENPPVTMAGGSAINSDQEQARIGSLTNCQNNGGSQCVTEVIAKNECAAAASNDYGEMTGASDPSLSTAETKAKGMLQNQQGAKIIVSGCASGSTPPPPPNQPPPPPAPKQGPTVSFQTIVGGLLASITDRSGVTSQCTYATDNYSRSFGLPANATYDLRIVPAVPQFRNWAVTITCDNGTSTTATTYF